MEIDHTCLGKEKTVQDVKETIEEAKKYNMNLCLPPWALDFVGEFDGKLMTVVDFPLGHGIPIVKKEEAKKYEVDEIDYCCNISYIKKDKSKLKDEARKMSELDFVTKAIIECNLLSEEEIRRASRICSQEGIDYIKTGTGFFGDVEVEHVKLINESCNAKIKASGGISSYKEAKELVNAGADRIGASSGVEIKT
jgi:deoxyribose-phosphate aldolase